MTLLCYARTHTQMKWSDSSVSDWKDIELGWIPRAVSWREKRGDLRLVAFRSNKL
jgi:hypothetical protein